MATGGQVLLGGNRSSSARHCARSSCSAVKSARCVLECFAAAAHMEPSQLPSQAAPLGGGGCPRLSNLSNVNNQVNRGVKEASYFPCQGGKLKSEGQVVKLHTVQEVRGAACDSQLGDSAACK